MRTKKIAVFTLTREREQYTRRTLERIYETAGVPFDHFILDNGSQDGTPQFLKSQTQLTKLILSPDNKGLFVGINTLLKETDHFSDYDYVCKVDNDVEFPDQDWLKRMLDVSEFNPNDKLMLSPYVDGLGAGTGGAPRKEYQTLNGPHYAETFGVSNHVGGICLFTRQELFEIVMPRTGGKAQGWDVWFCSVARQNGYRVGYLENLKIKHMDGSVKQVEDDPEYQKRKESEAKVPYDGDDNSYNVQF